MSGEEMHLCCCHGKCIRLQKPPESPLHALEESLLQAQIALECMSMDCDRPQFCEWIRNVEGKVCLGLVRREAAAYLASSFYHTTMNYASPKCSLLFVILDQTSSHRPGCTCLLTVLGWGTCATVICDSPGEKRQGRWWTKTAVGKMRWWPATHMYALLAYGSLPWTVYCSASYPAVLRVRRRMNDAYLDDTASPAQIVKVPIAQAEWCRWHMRRSRRLWLSRL
jgi:hypothetical protein